jgi:hypothetical protein
MLRILGRVCYGLSAASIVLSLGSQFRMSEMQGKARFFLLKKPPTTPRSERQSIFFGLWAPTFAIAGKILEDAAREQELRQMQGQRASLSSNNYEAADQQSLAALTR